jgi:Tfp pilus assembly protein PilN
MRRRLHLDFARPRPPRVWLGASLAVAGALAAAATLVQYHALAGEAARLEARIADAQRMARRDLPRLRQVGLDPRALAEEVRAANAVLAQLTIPWGALFREIEAAGSEDIALLSIQPDARARALRIAGEGRRFEDVLAYVARLESRPALADVFLASHELRDGGADRPVAFALAARWVDEQSRAARSDERAEHDGRRYGNGTLE